MTDHDTEIPPVASINTRITHVCECVALTRDQNSSSVKNIEKPVVLNSTEITPVKIRCLKVNREVKRRKQLALGSLSEEVTAKQTVQKLLDVDSDVKKIEREEFREGNLDEILLDEMENRRKEIQWNWRTRKKGELTMGETGKMGEAKLEGREKGEIKNVWGINMYFSKIAKMEGLNLEMENLDLEKEKLDLEKENLDLEKEEEELDLEEGELELEDVDRRIWTRPKKLRRSENIIKVEAKRVPLFFLYIHCRRLYILRICVPYRIGYSMYFMLANISHDDKSGFQS
ncbi:MAG: hypothetical protein GY820_30245 [Gammaproteobacteria bacterium]|nr:hypothetical protein [Gammaproteobacteria bacterium]